MVFEESSACRMNGNIAVVPNVKNGYVDYFTTILKEMDEIHTKKNADYGNNFHKRYEKYGFLTALLRLTDKMERLENIYEKGEIQVKDESVEDTLIDLANYAVMTVVELRNEKNKVEFESSGKQTLLD